MVEYKKWKSVNLRMVLFGGRVSALTLNPAGFLDVRDIR